MRQATLLRVAHKGFIFLPICWRFHPRYCSHQDVRSGCSCLQSCEDFGPAARAGDALRPLCKAAKPRAPCKGWPHATNSSPFRAIPRGDPLLSIPRGQAASFPASTAGFLPRRSPRGWHKAPGSSLSHRCSAHTPPALPPRVSSFLSVRSAYGNFTVMKIRSDQPCLSGKQRAAGMV